MEFTKFAVEFVKFFHGKLRPMHNECHPKGKPLHDPIEISGGSDMSMGAKQFNYSLIRKCMKSFTLSPIDCQINMLLIKQLFHSVVRYSKKWRFQSTRKVYVLKLLHKISKNGVFKSTGKIYVSRLLHSSSKSVLSFVSEFSLLKILYNVHKTSLKSHFLLLEYDVHLKEKHILSTMTPK